MTEIFVPGRLCILGTDIELVLNNFYNMYRAIGEHTDWAAQYIEQNPALCKGNLCSLSLY
jgi:hypothetical protein